MTNPPLSPQSPYTPTAPLAQEGEPKSGPAKGLSVLIALAVNALIFLALAWWTVVVFKDAEIELVVEAGTADAKNTIDRKEFQQKQLAKPPAAVWLESSASDRECGFGSVSCLL